MSDEAAFENEQRNIIEELLARPFTAREIEGFRIVYPRFIDRFGGTRLDELRRIFCTETSAGKLALAASLTRVAEGLGSYDQFVERYPVTIVPPMPAYPLFPILRLETLQPVVYRILNSRNPAAQHIKTTGRLPLMPLPVAPVLRQTPRGHWCAYDRWETPDETRRALQILPVWSDCAVRATLEASSVEGLAYVAYSVDPNDAFTAELTFRGYFYEGVTQDHDDAPYEYEGDAVQICVYGEPEVRLLEEWSFIAQRWETTWERSSA